MHDKDKNAVIISTGKKVIVYPHHTGDYVDGTDLSTIYKRSDIKLV